ncbi:hypothetical protein [Parageobacillus toebii]|jgi:hypothetical protein|uniref:hypothetical protein n=2 Tax=Parageobacillus toebii TaxID=153151 RepID=UPI00281684A8|nr:hypothetical protein [Parageobacillus toebii]WMT19692.1 hypothetical protein RFB12_03555 [Parageobacillus toebii]
MSEKKMTMQERIEYFYQQSGGPNNPRIQKIINNHLLYGKDHGISGKRETIKDAFQKPLLDDPSTSGLLLWLYKMIYDLQDRWKEFVNKPNPNEGLKEIAAAMKQKEESSIRNIEKRLDRLELKIEQLILELESYNNKKEFRNQPIKKGV